MIAPADLARRLQTGLAERGAPAAALAAAGRLATDRARVVIAGQQPICLGGPRYVFYKALAAIRLARWLEAQGQGPAVAVFWNHAEDHDLDEMASVWAPDGDRVRKLRLPLARDGRTAEGTALPLEAAREQLAFLLERWPELEPWARPLAPLADDTLASWFTRTLSTFLGPLGLVVLEPAWLWPLGQDFLERARSEAQACRAALSAGAERLRAQGRPAPLEPEAGARLYAIVGGVRCEPAPGLRLSPGVALRPVWQDALLPTAIAILGPSELAYQAQLDELHAHFGLVPPRAWPRPGVTVLEGRDRRLLEALGLVARDFLNGGHAPSPVLTDDPWPPRFADWETRGAALFDQIESALAALDPSLRGAVQRGARRLTGNLERLRGLATRAVEGRAGVRGRRLEALEAGLRPGGEPQERRLTWLPLAPRAEFWLEAIDPFELEHQIIGNTAMPPKQETPA